jgi:hypothetical protein
MSGKSLLTDPEAIRSNQNGQVTNDQLSSLRSKYSSLPGWFSIGVIIGLLVLAYLLAGKILAQSTPLAITALVIVILATFAIDVLLGGLLANLRMPRRISIEKVPGQVMWNNNRYTAVANGRTLEPVTDAFNMQPGDYTFYVLSGTNYLLSTQPAGMSVGFDGGVQNTKSLDLTAIRALLDQPLDFDPRMEPNKVAERLAQLKLAYENFDMSSAGNIDQQEAAELVQRMTAQIKTLMQGQSLPNLAHIGHEIMADSRPELGNDGVVQVTRALEQVGVRHDQALNANRAGKQTAGQRAELTRTVASNLLWSAGISIGWMVISYVLFTRSDWKGLLVVTAFLAVVLIAFLSGVRKELLDLMSGSVQIEEGPVTKFSRSSHTGHSSRTYYYYQINQYSLEVSGRAYDALIEGNYRVCFLPNTKMLVNIDPLPNISS